MPLNLHLCVSQADCVTYYEFKLTKMKVYSFEEALFHCYYYWKQSIDDFLSDKFIDWVQNSLGLSVIASTMKEMNRTESFFNRLLAFLSLTDYFNEQQLEDIKEDVLIWEKRLEWEKLKERADYLLNHDEPEKACILYKRALTYEENSLLLNNIGIASMLMGKYGDAASYLEKACRKEPSNIQLRLNLIEAFVLDKDYEMAEEKIEEAFEMSPENPDLYNFYGDIHFEQGIYTKAIQFYEKAINIDSNAEYIYKLCDVYMKMRFFEKAIDTIQKVKIKDKRFLKKQAEYYADSNNIPAAIKSIEKALIANKDSVDLWVCLARYHRLDYDVTRAQSAILKALTIAPGNPKALLESARIKKAQGRIKDYQIVLNSVLTGLKSSYRDTINIE